MYDIQHLLYYNKALSIQGNYSEQAPAYSALTYNSIGQLLAVQGDYQNALEHFNKAFSIQEKNSGTAPLPPYYLQFHTVILVKFF